MYNQDLVPSPKYWCLKWVWNNYNTLKKFKYILCTGSTTLFISPHTIITLPSLLALLCPNAPAMWPSPTQIFVAYRTWPPWSWAVWLTPLDEGLSPRHISSGLSLIWDSFSRRWCVHTSGRTVIFQSFWSQGLFTLLNYWGLQRASVSAGYIYWYLSYDRDQQTLAYGPNLAHDCFFVKKKLVEHSQVHLFMYCLWFFRAFQASFPISC